MIDKDGNHVITDKYGKPVTIRFMTPNTRQTARQKAKAEAQQKQQAKSLEQLTEELKADLAADPRFAIFANPLPPVQETLLLTGKPKPPRQKPLGKPRIHKKAMMQALYEHLAQYEALAAMDTRLVRLHSNIYATLSAIVDIFADQVRDGRTRNGGFKFTYSFLAKKRNMNRDPAGRTAFNHVKRLEAAGVFVKRRTNGNFGEARPNCPCIEISFLEKFVKFHDERHLELWKTGAPPPQRLELLVNEMLQKAQEKVQNFPPLSEMVETMFAHFTKT